MLHSCDQCPEIAALKENLESIFGEYEKEHIKFKQQKMDENKTNLLSCILSIEEFTEEVTSHFDTLRAHHFVATSQGHFLEDLEDLKETLKENELIILSDFAENYNFNVQNTVQGLPMEQ